MMTLFKQLGWLMLVSALMVGCGGSGGDSDVAPDQSEDSIGQPDGDVDGQSDGDVDGHSDGDQDDEPQYGSRKTSSMGMGLAGIADWTTQFPFLDFMKLSRNWYDWTARVDIPASQIDENGWLTSVSDGQHPGTVFLTNDSDASKISYDQFVVRWEGTGEISYHWAAQKTGSSHGGDLITTGTGSCLLRVDSSDPQDPVRNITIVPLEHVEVFDQGEIFNPDWIERIKDFRAIRFMDWMDTNNLGHETWEDRNEPDDRTYAGGGVPAEVMVELANKLNADPWFNMPHKADLDYMRRFAQIVKDQLNPHLLAYVEHSNEVWNWGFQQAQYALQQGQARWGEDIGNAHMQWHGMRTAQMCDVWKQEVFGNESNRVHCVLGTQGGWHGLESGALECPEWVGEGNIPCYQHGIDSIGITGYFSGCLHGSVGWPPVDNTEAMRAWFDDPDGGVQKALEQVVDGRHFECDDTLEGLQNTYEYFVDLASSLGMVVVAYEGGQHITGNGHAIQEDQDFIDFHIAINRAEGMKPVYTDNFEMWQDSGGTLFMHFVDFGRPSKYGSWGALEYLGQESSPRWEAITEFNNNVACWWPGCSE